MLCILFISIFNCSQIFLQKFAKRKSPKKYVFFSHLLFCSKCLGQSLNPHCLTSNKPTHCIRKLMFIKESCILLKMEKEHIFRNKPHSFYINFSCCQIFFLQKIAKRKSPKKYFFFHILFCSRCLEWSLNAAF